MTEFRDSQILENCLQRLDGGEDLHAVLEAYPEQAHKLKPLLLVAMASRAFPVPRPSERALRLGRNQMLAEMNRLEIQKAFRKTPVIPFASRTIGKLIKATRARGFYHLAHSYRLAGVALALIMAAGFLTISVSAHSRPGDLWYPLKQGLERAGMLQLGREEGNKEEPEQISRQLFQPHQFAHSIWTINNLNNDFTRELPAVIAGDQYTFSVNNLEELEREDIEDITEEQDLKDAEKEAEKELKDTEKEAEKELAADERETEKEEREAEKEAEKELRTAEKLLEKEDKDKE